MFSLDTQDVRLALGTRRRMICQMCGLGFDSVNGSAICGDCIGREPTPIQDNDAPWRSAWSEPREPAEIVVARQARADAEAEAAEYRRATWLLHQYLSTISVARGLLPRDQRRTATIALEQFAECFPKIAEIAGLPPEPNSPKLG